MPVPAAPRADPVALADRLHSAAIHLLRRLRKQDEALGLSAARLSVLSVVVFGGGPYTIGGLAEAEQVSAPTMTRLVVGLERDGLVTRRRDDRDRRVIWIQPTKKGARLLVEGRRRRVASLAARVEELGADEAAALERGVGIVERIVSAGGGGPAAWKR